MVQFKYSYCNACVSCGKSTAWQWTDRAWDLGLMLQTHEDWRSAEAESWDHGHCALMPVMTWTMTNAQNAKFDHFTAIFVTGICSFQFLNLNTFKTLFWVTLKHFLLVHSVWFCKGKINFEWNMRLTVHAYYLSPLVGNTDFNFEANTNGQCSCKTRQTKQTTSFSIN